MLKPVAFPLLLLLTPVGFTIGTVFWTSDIRSNLPLIFAIFGGQSMIAFPLLWFAPQLKIGIFSDILDGHPSEYIVPDHGVRLLTTFFLGLGIGTIASCVFGGIYSLLAGSLQCIAGLISLHSSYRRHAS